MDIDALRNEFVSRLLRADRPAAKELASEALSRGIDPADFLLRVVQPSMELVGRRWSRRQVSLTQNYVAARIADDIIDAVRPLLGGKNESAGRVVIGTITGDYHGLGRKIVAAFLRAAGFTVCDLGLGVSPEDFAVAAVEHEADVVGISALMVHTVDQIRQVRPLLEATGPNHARLVVGGAPFSYNRKLFREVGADAMARDAAEAVRVVRQLVRVAV